MSNLNLCEKLDPSQPIGIFDSGVGGLTVARAIVEKLPNENIIYFGDTAHFPYGEKSVNAIQDYSLAIADVLLKKGAKIIVIACNSASSAAYEVLRNHVGKRALVLNVIDPMAEFVAKNCSNMNVGLIGTKRTIASNLYQEKIAALADSIKLHAMPTPLLVAAIEEGFAQHEIIDEILKVYFDTQEFKNIEALILGCTHYPLIKDKIAKFYNNNIMVLDSSTTIASQAAEVLAAANLLNQGPKIFEHFYVSDYTEAFAHACELFFPEKIKLELYNN